MSFFHDEESMEDEDQDKKGEQNRSHGSFPRYTNDMPSSPPDINGGAKSLGGANEAAIFESLT